MIPCDAEHFSFLADVGFGLSFQLDEQGDIQSFQLAPDALEMGTFRKIE